VRRGDVYWVNLDPVVGSEIGKRRPAVILQNELANRTSPTVTIVPLSTRVDRVYPFQVHIPGDESGLGRDSKALCEQIRTVSRTRLLDKAGELPAQLLDEVRLALDHHLWL
jgi:mRNA interferase MazF